MGIFGDIGHLIMTPLYYVISFVMVGFHRLFGTFLDPDGGLSWALSIVGLTLVIRAALIPLFVKQIKSSRNMQLVQPKVKELQKKYGHDRERLAQETMKLYKDTGTNPFSSCLPILLQMPIFFALFRLLDQAAKNGTAHGVLTEDLARSFGDSELGGGIPISATFLKAGGDVGVISLASLLVLAMTATTFLTQRQLMSKNMPPDALSGPYAQQQKMLLYVLPVVFAVGGIAFPIGVLLYWTTSNLWTMGQQFYVIRNNPAPGTPAAKAKEERDRHRAERKGGAVAVVAEAPPEPEVERRPVARQQPKKRTRSQRRQSGAHPAGSSPSSPPTSGSGRKPTTSRKPNAPRKPTTPTDDGKKK